MQRNAHVQQAAAVAVKMIVCAYYRMSGKDQTQSIERQQELVRAYAAQRGWTIAAEYIDRAKSGSKDLGKRKAFLKMVDDSSKGDWSAILVAESSRFGRLDTLEGAPYKDKLRNNGVHLETATGETVNWSTSIGRIMDTVQSEANHEYSVKLSGNVVSGRVLAINQGYWAHGKVPYGYDRQLVEGSTVKMVVPRVELFRKPKTWKLKVIPNEQEAAIVLWLFETMARGDVSLTRLTAMLQAKAPSPYHSKGWGLNAVYRILTNPIYKGDMVIGGRTDRQRGKFTRADVTVNKGAAPAIVAPALWQQVQLVLTKQKDQRKVEGAPREPRKGIRQDAALSGVLICGHCGYRMSRQRRDSGIVYVCSSYRHRPGLVQCKARTVKESDIIGEVCRVLYETIDFELLQSIQSKPTPADSSEYQELQRQAANLEGKVKRGSVNLVAADPELFPALQAALKDLQAQLMGVKASIAIADQINDNGGTDWERWWSKVRGQLITVAARGRVVEVEDRFPCVLTKRQETWFNKLVGEGCPGSAALRGRKIERDEQGNYYEWRYVEAPGNGNIVAEASALRSLLLRLGVTVTLAWTPNGSRYWSLEEMTVRGEFGGEFGAIKPYKPYRPSGKHITPISEGGSFDAANLLAECRNGEDNRTSA